MIELTGESKSVVYKQAYTKTILKTVCAYANFHDGYIVFGIKDNGTLCGVDAMNALRLNIEHAINDAIIPCPFYEFEANKIDGLDILQLKVYKGDHTPYTYQGKSYMRRDTSTIQTDPLTHQNLILYGRNLGYEDLPSPVQTLSFSYLEDQMRKHFQITALTGDLMRTLGFIQNQEYNIAAALLSDENPQKSAVVQLVAFSDIGVGRIKDRATLASCSVLKQFEACIDFYKKHINTGEIIEAAYRVTVEDVPFIAYREAIANMLVHRDYAMGVDARVEIYTNRIEIISPGGLPIGVLPEEFIEGKLSNPRNRKLADIFLRLKIIEKLATGIRRIKEQYSHQAQKPSFLVSDHAVVVVLPFVSSGNGSNQSVVKEARTIEGLMGKEKDVFQIILKQPMTKRSEIQKLIGLEKSQTVALLNRLQDLGWIIKVGNGPATGYKVHR